MKHPIPTRPTPVFLWGALIPLSIWLICLWAILAVGCSSTPVALAQTPLQRAYALYGEFVVAEEAAADLRQRGLLYGAPLKGVQQADALAKPLADALLQATRDYLQTRAVGNIPDTTALTQATEKAATAIALLAAQLEHTRQ